MATEGTPKRQAPDNRAPDNHSLEHRVPPALSRRRVLELGAVGAGAGLAAGCTDTSGQSNTRKKVSEGDFKIPDRKIPQGKAKLSLTDSDDTLKDFWKPFIKAYQKKHDNVTITYKGLDWPSLNQSVTLGLRQGHPPDVFFLPNTITTAQAVKENWVGAWDDIVPDWENVKKKFPVGQLADGKTDFDGKTYVLPTAAHDRFNQLMLFNKKMVEKADFDLSEIISWEDYRKLLKKITKQGDGKYYGTIIGLKQSGAGSMSTLAQMAGVRNGITGVDYKTGEYNFTDPISVEAVELLMAIHKDGSIAPGSKSYKFVDARKRFSQDQAGVIIQGPWAIAPVKETKGTSELGIGIPAQRDPKKVWPVNYAPGNTSYYHYDPKTKHAKIIGDIFKYVLSDDGQSQWASIQGAASPPAMPDAVKTADLSKLDRQAMKINEKYMVVGPEPAVRNHDVEKVYKVQKPLEPDFPDVVLGLLTGQVKGGAKKAMKDLQDRANKALDEAIHTAKKRGAKVSRDDWVFSDWDPKKPYEKHLKK